MTRKEIELQLSGGHPNSLGDTIRVVDQVLVKPELIKPLFECYLSDDEVVRMRVSNAMKRIARANPSLIIPYIDRFLDEVSQLDQASAQWSLAQLFLILENEMSTTQRQRATEIMMYNLKHHSDWIVLNMTLETLGNWSKKDPSIRKAILARVKELMADPRKSVAKKATKTMAILG